MLPPRSPRSRPATGSGDADQERGTKATARDRALRLLAVRDRSTKELERRLKDAGFGAEEVRATVEDLRDAGLVDDVRFARLLVRDLTYRRGAGVRAVEVALRQKGIGEELVREALKDAGDEAERARALVLARLRRVGALRPDVAYRRLFGLLLRRGYDPSVARETCRQAIEERFSGVEGFTDGR